MRIVEGDETSKIDQAIARTVEFFELLNVPTKLSAYNVGKESIDQIINRLEKRKAIPVGERGNIDSEIIRSVMVDRL